MYGVDIIVNGVNLDYELSLLNGKWISVENGKACILNDNNKYRFPPYNMPNIACFAFMNQASVLSYNKRLANTVDAMSLSGSNNENADVLIRFIIKDLTKNDIRLVNSEKEEVIPGNILASCMIANTAYDGMAIGIIDKNLDRCYIRIDFSNIMANRQLISDPNKAFYEINMLIKYNFY